MQKLFSFGSLGLVALALACGGSTSSGSGTGGSSTGGSSTGGASTGGASTGGASTGGASTGGSGGSGGCTSLVPCCDANGNNVDWLCQNGTPYCPEGSSFPPNGICAPAGSCSPTTPCAADEYCDYPDDRCGVGAAGTCKKRPQGCDFLYAPVCACNGQMASNDCVAYTAGNDLNANGGCPPPDGTFACGTKFCMTGTSYCQHGISDIGGEADTFTCMPMPAACMNSPSCACLANEPCGAMCSADGAGNMTVTCPGG